MKKGNITDPIVLQNDTEFDAQLKLLNWENGDLFSDFINKCTPEQIKQFPSVLNFLSATTYKSNELAFASNLNYWLTFVKQMRNKTQSISENEDK